MIDLNSHGRWTSCDLRVFDTTCDLRVSNTTCDLRVSNTTCDLRVFDTTCIARLRHDERAPQAIKRSFFMTAGIRPG